MRKHASGWHVPQTHVTSTPILAHHTTTRAGVELLLAYLRNLTLLRFRVWHLKHSIKRWPSLVVSSVRRRTIRLKLSPRFQFAFCRQELLLHSLYRNTKGIRYGDFIYSNLLFQFCNPVFARVDVHFPSTTLLGGRPRPAPLRKDTVGRFSKMTTRNARARPRRSRAKVMGSEVVHDLG